MKIEMIRTADLIPYEHNPRKNEKAVEKVANSIREFGFKSPIIVDRNNVIVCGHTRQQAALQLGIDAVPCIRADDLSDEQIKAYRLADNKTAEMSEWDFDELSKELDALMDDFDMTQFGFEFKDEKTKEKDVDVKEVYEVIIECENEVEQEAVFDKLSEEGYVCRVSTL